MFAVQNNTFKQLCLKCVVNHKYKPQLRFIAYIQGQEPEPKVREYFYYIDHQGMLFLDDSRMKNFTSCFKEKKFLRFFFNQLRRNTTGRYEEFPYLSICGKERNFVRCDDYPFVYTHVIQKSVDVASEDLLAYNHAGDLLALKFEPERVFMLPQSGRVYHPAPEKVGSIGLVRSKLAIELSKYFVFENGELEPPTHFNWKDRTYLLDTRWFNHMLRNKGQVQNPTSL